MVRAAAEDDALHGRDVAIVAAPAKQHVFVLHDDAVGRIEIDPITLRMGGWIIGGCAIAGWAEPGANPGVRLIRALPPRPARRRLCANISRIVPRRQAKPAQCADHDMAEILTHALAPAHDIADRRGYC